MVEVTIHHMKKGMMGEWRQPVPWCLHSGRERERELMFTSLSPSFLAQRMVRDGTCFIS